MNKHKVIAIFMAPVLLIGGYIVAGYYQEQSPARVKMLQTTVDCRLLHSECQLEIPALKLTVSAQGVLAQQALLSVDAISSVPLDDLLISLGNPGADSFPAKLKPGADPMHWHGQVLITEHMSPQNLELRLVVIYKTEMYFAELPVKD